MPRGRTAAAVVAAAALAALEYLQRQFPHLRGLQTRPALLVRFASARHEPTTPLLGQLVPLLAQFAEELPGLLLAIRRALGSPPAHESSPPPTAARVRFVQR